MRKLDCFSISYFNKYSFPLLLSFCLFLSANPLWGGAASINPSFQRQAALVVPTVELIAFTAKEEEGKALVEWTTEGKLLFDRYELERSTDGFRFERITSILASSGEEKRDYAFIDYSAVAQNFYRLKVIGHDDSFKYSTVIAIYVDYKAPIALSVFPETVFDEQTLHVRMHTSQPEAKLMLKDIRGDVVKVLYLPTDKGWNQLRLDVSDLPKGTYSIVNTMEDERTQAKFMKIKT